MNIRPTHLLSLFAAASVGLTAPAVAYGAPAATDTPVPSAIGLTTDQHLITFKVNDPWTAAEIGAISGLDGDATIVGIDYRVQDGLLYGLGDAGGVYSFEGAAGTKVSQLTVTLEGTYWGVDFNPATDRLRIVSDSGQNLSHNLELDADPTTIDGDTTEDTDLNYPAGANPALGVSAIAYTNNDLDDSTDFTLFDIDTDLNQTVTQVPPASGVLTLVGALGLDPATDAGFDIHSTLDENGVAASNNGYAALSINGVYGLWDIDLTTGAATEVCDFPDAMQVTDLAVQLG